MRSGDRGCVGDRDVPDAGGHSVPPRARRIHRRAVLRRDQGSTIEVAAASAINRHLVKTDGSGPARLARRDGVARRLSVSSNDPGGSGQMIARVPRRGRLRVPSAVRRIGDRRPRKARGNGRAGRRHVRADAGDGTILSSRSEAGAREWRGEKTVFSVGSAARRRSGATRPSLLVRPDPAQDFTAASTSRSRPAPDDHGPRRHRAGILARRS